MKTYSFHDLSAVLMASFTGSMRGKSTGTPCKPCIFWQPILALFIRIHPQFVVGFPPSFSGFIRILGLRLACGSPHSRCSAVGFASESARYSEVLAEQGWRGVRSIWDWSFLKQQNLGYGPKLRFEPKRGFCPKLIKIGVQAWPPGPKLIRIDGLKSCHNGYTRRTFGGVQRWQGGKVWPFEWGLWFSQPHGLIGALDSEKIVPSFLVDPSKASHVLGQTLQYSNVP